MGSRAGLITSHKVALLTLIGIYVERDTPRDLSLFLINAIKVRKPFSHPHSLSLSSRALFSLDPHVALVDSHVDSHVNPHTSFLTASSLRPLVYSLAPLVASSLAPLASLRRLLHSSLRRLLAPLTSLASPRFAPLASLVSPRFAPLASLVSLADRKTKSIPPTPSPTSTGDCKS